MFTIAGKPIQAQALCLEHRSRSNEKKFHTDRTIVQLLISGNSLIEGTKDILSLDGAEDGSGDEQSIEKLKVHIPYIFRQYFEDRPTISVKDPEQDQETPDLRAKEIDGDALFPDLKQADDTIAITLVSEGTISGADILQRIGINKENTLYARQDVTKRTFSEGGVRARSHARKTVILGEKGIRDLFNDLVQIKLPEHELLKEGFVYSAGRPAWYNIDDVQIEETSGETKISFTYGVVQQGLEESVEIQSNNVSSFEQVLNQAFKDAYYAEQPDNLLKTDNPNKYGYSIKHEGYKKVGNAVKFEISFTDARLLNLFVEAFGLQYQISQPKEELFPFKNTNPQQAATPVATQQPPELGHNS